MRDLVEEPLVLTRDGRDVLRLLLAAFDLEAANAGVGDRGEVLVGSEILRRDEVASIELAAVSRVGENVVLPARLCAGAAIGAALRDHPRHVALAGVGDAERAVHERLEAERGHGRVNRADVVEGVLAGEHHALDTELLHDRGAGGVVHRHLRRSMQLERGVDALDQPDDADVLDDGCVDSAIDGAAEESQRIAKLGGLEEDVEGEVNPAPALVSDPARLLHFVHRQLRALVPGVEPLGAKIDRVGAIGDGSADGVEGAGGSEKFGDALELHKP